jgi:hypothetical protein
MSDSDIQTVENQFPALAGAAFAAAHKEAIEAGFSVLEAKDGFVYECFPDGTQKVVKRIKPPTRVGEKRIYKIR